MAAQTPPPVVKADASKAPETDKEILDIQEELDEEDSAPALAAPIGDPIQCIALRKFFDERGALIKAGATYFYQEREGVPFPAKVLEPVSKAKAAAVRKEQRAIDEERADERRMQARRRAEFSRLIG